MKLGQPISVRARIGNDGKARAAGVVRKRTHEAGVRVGPFARDAEPETIHAT